MGILFLSKKFYLISLCAAVVYFLLGVYVMNSSFILATVIGDYPLADKFMILFSIIKSLPISMQWYEFVVLFSISLLTGLNVALLVNRVVLLKNIGKVHAVVGGGMVLGIATSGCVSCGLSVLALVGLSSSLIYLPFRGAELSLLSLLLLGITFFYLVKDINKTCKIDAKYNRKSEKRK